jgi:hypothetical protein
MSVAATIVIKFGESAADSSALALVELDDSRNVDAAGEVKSSFAPGDVVYFLVHHASELRIGSVVPTDGYVVNMGRTQFARKSQQLFADGEAVSLSYLPAGGVAPTWYGRTSALTQNGQQLVAVDPPVIGDLSFTIDAALYRLQTPSVTLAEEQTYPVAVVVTMEAAV